MELDHFSINVSDQARSTRFYCEGLGFEHVEDSHHGSEAAGATLLEGDYRVHSRHLRGGGITLILNHTEIPAAPLPEYRRQYGLTNFAVRVNDLDASVERLRSFGGTPVETSRTTFPVGTGAVDVIICLDPDGQPVELIAPARAGAPRATEERRSTRG